MIRISHITHQNRGGADMNWSSVHEKIIMIKLGDISRIPLRLGKDLKVAESISKGLVGYTRTHQDKQKFLYCMGICNDAIPFI